MKLHYLLVAALVACGLLLGGAGVAAASGTDTGDKKDKHKKGGGSEKVTICHKPPGNPANAQTITVSENALGAHFAHGDSLGPCEDKKHKKKY